MSKAGPTPSERILSFLDVVATCDNFHLKPSHEIDTNQEKYTPFFVSASSAKPLGLLRPQILDLLLEDNTQNTNKGSTPSWLVTETSSGSRVQFHTSIDTAQKRSAVLKDLSERWRDLGRFPDVCGPKKWRGEEYSVFVDPFGSCFTASAENTSAVNDNLAFKLERSACALFGLVTYGVHMTIYHNDPGSEIMVWVPVRAQTKQTWPGYLDNSVAGGISSGMAPFESVIKEAMEEASVPEDQARKHIKTVGAISYFFRTSDGWLQPEIEFEYEMCIPLGTDFQPKPLDGEVESFECMTLSQVVAKMRLGLFKPNCAMVLLDFLIRHGHVTPDNEPDYMEIMTRLHSRFDYNLW